MLYVWQYNLGLLDARDAELAQYDISSAALEVMFIRARVLKAVPSPTIVQTDVGGGTREK